MGKGRSEVVSVLNEPCHEHLWKSESTSPLTLPYTSKFHSKFPFIKHYFDLLHFTFSEMYLRKEIS